MFKIVLDYKSIILIIFIILVIIFLLYMSNSSHLESLKQFLEEKQKKIIENNKLLRNLVSDDSEIDNSKIAYKNKHNIINNKNRDINMLSHSEHLSQIKYTDNNSLKEGVSEEFCRDIFESIYKKPFPKIRPDFLINKKTGKKMELDGYNEELKIAFEYQGIQHYNYPNFTGQSEKEFLDQVKRDKLKMDICDENNIYLITIPYYIKPSNLRNFIIKLLPENNINN